MDPELLSRLYQDHVTTLEGRYAAALAESGFDAVAVHSGTPLAKTRFDDQFWPLRTTPELMRWAPLHEADALLVVTPGRKPVLFWPPATSFWERPAAPEARHFEECLDIRREAATRASIAEVVGSGKRVAFVGDDAARAEELGLPANPPTLSSRLEAARTTKTAYEIACLAEANRRAAAGHEAVRKAFAAGARGELDLHLAFLAATRQDDPDTPYKNIVALGESAAVLHHVSYGKGASRAESLLLDAGATFLGYCSDITRTWTRPDTSAGGVASPAAQTFDALVAAMEAMQQRLVAAVATGTPYERLHDESHRQVSAILKEAGLARGSVEEIDARGISRAFYPHGLGHSLGLVTHDVGCAVVAPRADNPFLRNTSIIEEGQVFTIEPGLYFIDGLLDALRAKPEGELVDFRAVAALAPFGGIRIEDDVLVTNHGVRNFTREVLPVGGGRAAG